MRTTPNQRISWQDFGFFLGQLRRRRGLSQQRFADAVGCNRITIWKLEKGRSKPSQLLLHNLARSCALTEQEERMIEAFEQLHESHLASYDLIPSSPETCLAVTSEVTQRHQR